MSDHAGDLQELADLEHDLVEVAAALSRLDDGSYGTCEVCARSLTAEVAADPLTRRCPEHAEAAGAHDGPGLPLSLGDP